MPCHSLKYTAIAFLAVGLESASGQPSLGPEPLEGFCRLPQPAEISRIQLEPYLEAWLGIGNYVCGSQAEGIPAGSIAAQLEEVNLSISELFADVTGNCRAAGDEVVRAQAFAFVEERAEAVGEGVAEILDAADVCGQCTAAVRALVETSQALVRAAVAEGWTELYILSDFGTDTPVSAATSRVVTEVLETGFSGIADAVRAAADDNCSIEAINAVQVSDFVSGCEAPGGTSLMDVDTEAMAAAGVRAREYACEGDIAESEVDAIALAAAAALTVAFAEADIVCEENGGEDAMSCGLLLPDTRAVVARQATVFAAAFAELEAAVCNCDVSGSGGVEVWLEIWEAAVANAYAETCSVGNGEEFVTEFQVAVERRMVTATARAIRDAVADASEADGNTCRAPSSTCSPGSPECVGFNGQCGGSDFDHVLPCCDPEHRCFVRDERRFFCRDRSVLLPSIWDGRIAECDLPQ